MNLISYLFWMATNAIKFGKKSPASGAYTKPTPVTGSVFDDFDGEAGAVPDTDLWACVDGEPRGISTCVAENAVLDGSGNLALSATKQEDGSWNAALIHCKQPTEYGTYAARIKFSGGHGFHQSFWTLGSRYNFANYSAGQSWPACGEMDIMECIADGKYYFTVHGPRYKLNSSDVSMNQSQVSGMLGFTPRLDYHVYWAKKQPGRVDFGIDATWLGAIGRLSIPKGAPWELDVPQQMILSFTVNASDGWGGGTDDTTPDTGTMLVDWVSFTPL